MNTKELEELYQKYFVINQLVEESKIPLSLILSITNLLQNSQYDFSQLETEEYLSLLHLFAQEMLNLSDMALANMEAIESQELIDSGLGE